MARTPKTITVPADDNFDPQRLEEAGQAAQQLQQIQAGFNDERDLANQLWGQIQMADAIAKLTTVVGLTKLREIKETKLYRAFAGKLAVDRDGNKIPDVGTWDGFCRALGTSANKVDEDLLNLRVFGEAAMDNLSRVGAGYRELRQFRRLPEDQKTALIEVAKSGDKESFVELAEEIISKHTKEKEELTKRATEVEANYEKQGELIGGKDRKINELEMKLSKQRVSLTDWPEEFQGYINQVQHARRLIEQNIGALDIIRTDSMSHEAAPGEEAALEKAREALGLELATAISRAKEVIEAAQHVFDKTLGALIGE